MRWVIVILGLLPLSLWAQEFPFQQEFDTIPMQIAVWEPFQPWCFGLEFTTLGFADLDGDVDFDLAVGEWHGSLNYFQNSGTPQSAYFDFVSQDFDSLQGGWEWMTDPCFVDMDADGDLDLINGYARFFRNVGNALEPDFEYDTLLIPSSYDDKKNEAADLDADGDYDLICGGYAGDILFAENVGTPQEFQFIVITTQLAGINVGGWSHPELCDIDADGDLDLVVGNQDGRLSYYRNDGTPQQYNFTLVSSYWLSLDVGDYSSPEFCDIDGDGDWDLFVGCTQGDANFYENTGTAVLFNFEYVTANYLTMDVGHDPIVQQVDMDADGDLDLMCATGSHIRYYQNIGTAQEPSYILEDQMFQNITLSDIMPYFCDIDADGDYDLVAGTSAIPGPPSLHLYLNRGTSQQPQLSLYSSTFVTGDFFVIITATLADIDADGDLDLFITDDDQYGVDDIFFYENTGSASWPEFQLVTANWQGISFGPIQRYLRFHDIDADGDLDLFFYNNWNESGGGNIRFYKNQGTPQNAAMSLVTPAYLPVEAHQSCLWFCDIDDDGHDDLFLGEMYGGVLFFHGLADTSGWVMPPVQRHPLAGLQISLGPNPANPFVVASFELRVASNMSLEVYDLLGRRVAELASGFHLPGQYRYVWDAGHRAAGMYIIRLSAGEEKQFEKLVLLK